jgi:hypothetical protein
VLVAIDDCKRRGVITAPKIERLVIDAVDMGDLTWL